MNLQKATSAVSIIIVIMSVVSVSSGLISLYQSFEFMDGLKIIKTHFEVPLVVEYLLLVSFIFGLIGGLYLYRLRRPGRVLFNLMFIIQLSVLLVIFFPNQYELLVDSIFDVPKNTPSHWYHFFHADLGNWYECIIPVIYFAALLFINAPRVTKQLR